MLAAQNILQRTFYLKCDTEGGTCFTIDVDGRQYIVTAWHVAKSIQERHTVQIMHDKSWKDFEVQLVGHGGSMKDDISVFTTSLQLSSPQLKLVLEGGGNNYFLSQEICFLGYPYGFTTEVGKANNYFALPWAKGGIISSWNSEHIFLDGHNNKGFSGGPVVCKIGKEKLAVIGVVSSYIGLDEPTYLLNEGEDSIEQTELRYKYNTGIVVVRKIELALDMIRKNPIGFVLPTDT